MRNIPSKNTLPEIIVRKRLFSCGWRFRVCDRRLQGKPDVVIPKAKTIIDIRGCFWHRHGCKDSTMPNQCDYYCYVLEEEVSLGDLDVPQLFAERKREKGGDFKPGAPIYLKGGELIGFRR